MRVPGSRPLHGQYPHWIFCFVNTHKKYTMGLRVLDGSAPSTSSRARFNVVTDIFLLKNSSTPPRAVALRLAQCKRKTSQKLQDVFQLFALCACQDSNLGPVVYKTTALPTELHAHAGRYYRKNSLLAINFY